MRPITLCTLSFAALLAAMATVPAPADAAPKKQTVTRTTHVAAVSGRPRARITVQRRSFLDPGNMVLPGTDGSTYYVQMPGQYPGDVLQFTTFDRSHNVLPGELSAAGPPRSLFPWNW